MRWLKHFSDTRRNPKVCLAENRLGEVGYGRFFKLLEVLAEHGDDGTSFTPRLDLKQPHTNPRWLAAELRISKDALEKTLPVFAHAGLIDPKAWRQRMIYVPAMLKYRDEWSRKRQREAKLRSVSGGTPAQLAQLRSVSGGTPAQLAQLRSDSGGTPAQDSESDPHKDLERNSSRELEEKAFLLFMKTKNRHDQDKIRAGVRLATLLASSPPRSLNFYQRAVPDILNHLPEKLEAWLGREAIKLLGQDDIRQATVIANLREDLKQRAAAEGFRNYGPAVETALEAADRRQRGQAELAVGRPAGLGSK